MNGDLAAAILVGGRSRRMGTNKALVAIEPDGRPVVETVANVLKAVASDVVLVGSESAEYGFLGLRQVADRFPGTGVLGGIASALLVCEHSPVLVVGCDMPFLNVDLLRYMTSLPRNYDVLAPHLDRPQPLHAIYSQRSLAVIERQLESGNFRATDLFDHLDVRWIDQETSRQYDPTLLSSFNMNSPADLMFARQAAIRT